MYENKVSARQLRRMIFIETFGAGALSIPAFACYKEQNGFWSLIFYGVFLAGTIAFFIIFSGKISEENFENRKIGKTGLARDANVVTLITKEGEKELPIQTKDEVSYEILNEIMNKMA